MFVSGVCSNFVMHLSFLKAPTDFKNLVRRFYVLQAERVEAYTLFEESVYLSICLSVCLSLYLSICLSVYQGYFEVMQLLFSGVMRRI